MDGVEGCMASGGAMGMKGKICSGSVANGVGVVEGVMVGVIVTPRRGISEREAVASKRV